eukprot:TRINITY_DN7067_c1_g1_i10.p1 TRINITY_DN7067_c1_g1~~TRINITY_DN7067_c1_g1_i10.p1  ORF type:complete len:117 (-),score=15.75 TRINITY_DN7067_c1_g1_i10:560-910(-)
MSTKKKPLFVESIMNRLTPKRRNSWCVSTPECAKGLEWSPSIMDQRTPRTDQYWQPSPLRGTPARRLFSWSWDGEFSQENKEVVDTLEAKVPLTDLNSRTTYMLDIDDYERLPPVL